MKRLSLINMEDLHFVKSKLGGFQISKKKQARILDGIGSLIVPYFIQNWKDNADSRLIYIIIRRICIKIKSNDIIRFLIGQFELIIGQIKVNYV